MTSLAGRLTSAKRTAPKQVSLNLYVARIKTVNILENVLYLDRRNVEVDPNEQLDRQFYPNNNDRRVPSLPDNTHHDRYRQQDDEFGAVESKFYLQILKTLYL